jgi:hypothetical protein
LKASAADREAILNGDKVLVPPRIPTDADLERLVAVVGVMRVWDALAKSL